MAINSIRVTLMCPNFPARINKVFLIFCWYYIYYSVLENQIRLSITVTDTVYMCYITHNLDYYLCTLHIFSILWTFAHPLIHIFWHPAQNYTALSFWNNYAVYICHDIVKFLLYIYVLAVLCLYCHRLICLLFV